MSKKHSLLESTSKYSLVDFLLTFFWKVYYSISIHDLAKKIRVYLT